MDLQWGQNITERLEDPNSFLQPCVMFQLCILFCWTFKFSVPHLRHKQIYVSVGKKKRAKHESIFLRFKAWHASSQRGEDHLCNDIYLNIAVLFAFCHIILHIYPPWENLLLTKQYRMSAWTYQHVLPSNNLRVFELTTITYVPTPHKAVAFVLGAREMFMFSLYVYQWVWIWMWIRAPG